MPIEHAARRIDGDAKEEFKAANQDTIKNLDEKDLEAHLTEGERAALKRRELSFGDLVELREIRHKAARDKLVELNTEYREHFSNKEYSEMLNELDELKTPGRIEEFMQGKVAALEKNLATQKAETMDKHKELSPDDPTLKALEGRYLQILEKQRKYIGENHIDAYKDFITSERKKTPTVARMEYLIGCLNGDIDHPDGILPRKEAYNKMQQICRKYGIASPLESKFYKEQGHKSGRQDFYKNAKDLEEHFAKKKDLGYYAPEVIEKEMQSALTCSTLEKQRGILDMATRKVQPQETKNFETDRMFDKTLTIAGVTVREISKKSKTGMMAHYKTLRLKDRVKNMEQMPGFIRAECELIFKLKDIYINPAKRRNDEEGLKTALREFSEMDFAERSSAIIDQAKEINDKDEKNKIIFTTIVHGATHEIGKAKEKGILSAETAKRMLSNFIDPKKTHKKSAPDLELMEEKFKTLTSKTPETDRESRNLIAYEKERDKYAALLKFSYGKDYKSIASRQKEYDEMRWDDRMEEYQALKEETIISSPKNQEKSAEAQEHLAKSTLLDKILDKSHELIKQQRYSEAIKKLGESIIQHAHNTQLVKRLSIEIGNINRLRDEMQDEVLEEEMEGIIQNDNTVAAEIEEQGMVYQATDLVKDSMALNDQKIRAEDRSLHDALDEADSDLEEGLIREFVNTEHGYIVENEGEGSMVAEVDEITVGKNLSKEETSDLRETLKESRRGDQSIPDNQIQLTTKEGRVISAQEGAAQQEQHIKQHTTHMLIEKVGQEGDKDEYLGLATAIGLKRKKRNSDDIQKRAQEKVKEEMEEYKFAA